MKVGEPERYKCPYCGKLVVIDKRPDGKVFIDHIIPICDKFDALCKAHGGKEEGKSVRDGESDKLLEIIK